jgi:hypothetical protein
MRKKKCCNGYVLGVRDINWGFGWGGGGVDYQIFPFIFLSKIFKERHNFVFSNNV